MAGVSMQFMVPLRIGITRLLRNGLFSEIDPLEANPALLTV